MLNILRSIFGLPVRVKNNREFILNVQKSKCARVTVTPYLFGHNRFLIDFKSEDGLKRFLYREDITDLLDDTALVGMEKYVQENHQLITATEIAIERARFLRHKLPGVIINFTDLWGDTTDASQTISFLQELNSMSKE